IKLMIWATIGFDVTTPLVFVPRDPGYEISRYIAQSYLITLEEGLVLVNEPGRPFQQDNTRNHVARKSQEWFETHGTWVIKGPPYRPGLKPTRESRKVLKQELYRFYSDLNASKDDKADI